MWMNTFAQKDECKLTKKETIGWECHMMTFCSKQLLTVIINILTDFVVAWHLIIICTMGLYVWLCVWLELAKLITWSWQHLFWGGVCNQWTSPENHKEFHSIWLSQTTKKQLVHKQSMMHLNQDRNEEAIHVSENNTRWNINMTFQHDWNICLSSGTTVNIVFSASIPFWFIWFTSKRAENKEASHSRCGNGLGWHCDECGFSIIGCFKEAWWHFRCDRVWMIYSLVLWKKRRHQLWLGVIRVIITHHGHEGAIKLKPAARQRSGCCHFGWLVVFLFLCGYACSFGNYSCHCTTCVFLLVCGM